MSEETKNSNIMDLDYAVTYRLYAFKSLALILGETGNHDFSEILFNLYYLAEKEITDILDCVSREVGKIKIETSGELVDRSPDFLNASLVENKNESS